MCSASRTIASARKCARYSACSAAVSPGSAPIGRRAAGAALVEHAARGSRCSARSSQPGELGCRVGRGASLPGPPCRKTSSGRSRPSGSATSRAKTVMRSPSGRAWSSGTANSCSVSTRPRVANEAGMPGFSTLRARGPQRARDPGPRLPAGEAAHDARRVPPEPQRAAPGVQPVDQPRPGHRVRRGDHPRRAAPPLAAALGAAGQRARGAARRSTATSSTRRSGCPRTSSPCCACSCSAGAQTPGELKQRTRAAAPDGRPRGGARRARAPDRPRARRAPAAPAGPEGGALRAAARRGRRGAGTRRRRAVGRRRTAPRRRPRGRAARPPPTPARRRRAGARRPPAPAAPDPRVTRLEEEVAALRADLGALRASLDALREELGA